MVRHFDFVVVGKGMMGAAAARHLAMTGATVALVGRGEPADWQKHDGVFASHYDSGRITRTIRRAHRLGWAPPLAWDDIDNDDAPAAAPYDRDDVDEIAIEPSNLSQQLAVLRRASLVASSRRDGEVVYSVRAPAVRDLLFAARSLLSGLAASQVELEPELRPSGRTSRQ